MTKLEINGERCKSCGYCILYCAKKVLGLGEKINSKGYQYVAVKDPEACVGCMMCANICPEAAIEIYK